MGYYVVETYSGKDAEAAEALADAGYIVFRPVVHTVRPHHRYKGVTVKHQNHLMPGYLFVERVPAYLGQDMDLNPAYQANYVLSILGQDEDTPCEIPSATVDLIRKLADALSQGETALEFWSKLEPKAAAAVRSWLTGDEVICEIGTRAYPGIVIKDRGRDRIVVELQMKGRLQKVTTTSGKLKIAA